MSQRPDTTCADEPPLTEPTSPKTYPCPRCQTLCAWQDNPYKPFCSERCKLIDFGAWANEDYRLPSEDTPMSEE